MPTNQLTAPRAAFLLVVIASLTGCPQGATHVDPGTTPDGGEVPQTLNLQAQGLYLTDNPLASPPGSMETANNAVVVRNGIAEVRRGNKPDATTSAVVDSLGAYVVESTTTVIGHTIGNKLTRRSSSTTSTDYAGTWAPVDATMRMQFNEENTNFYALTSGGVVRISNPADSWKAAGAPPALEGTGSLTGASGFLSGLNAGSGFPGLASVAYRFVWGNRDSNGNLHLGAPSGRLVVTNNTLVGADVALVERLPAGITTGTDFLQVYRTDIAPHTVSQTSTASIVRTVRASSVATITTSGDHGFATGDVVLMPAFTLGSFSGGLKTIASTPTTKTFTYSDSGTDYPGASGTVSNAARTSSVTTITTSSAHGFAAGDVVNMPPTTVGTAVFSAGLKTIATVPSTTTFTYADSGPDVASGASSAGTVYLAAVGTVAGTSRVAVDPGEEMAQVAELFPTTADVTAGTISYTDVATTANGPTAYFAPSQGGLVLAREVPPISRDVAQFKGYEFYAVKSARQTAQLALLSVGGSAGLRTGEGIRIIYNDASVDLYQGGATESTNPADVPAIFKVYTSGTAAQNIENTARSLVRVVNLVSYGRLYATYASAQNDPPGKIVLMARTLSEGVFTVQGYGGSQNPWAPALQTYWPVQLNRFSNVTTAYSTTVTHGLTAGQQVTLSNATTGFTNGVKTISSVFDELTIEYSDTGSNATGTGVITTNVTALTSSDAVFPNTWARSDYQDGESVPVFNYGQVGSSAATLYRIVAQGDSLWFFTSEGLYRLTGTDETDFTLRPFDPTVILLTPDSVAVAGNRVYAWTSQGVVSVSEAGVQVISAPIDKALRELRAAYETAGFLDALSQRTFGVAYETEREYRLWLPTTTSDGYATQCFVYNFGTGAWTRHTVSARAGIVTPGDDRLYLADVTARLTQERKTRTAADYQDADGVGIPFEVVYAANVAGNAGGTKWWQKASFLFETAAPVSVGVEFSTEVAPSATTGTLTTNGLTYVSTYMPVEQSRSAVLYAGVTHSTAAEKCSVVGVSIEYQPVSNVLR